MNNQISLEEQLEVEKAKLNSITIEFNFVIGRQRGRVELLEELLGIKEEEESTPPPEATASDEETVAAG